MTELVEESLERWRSAPERRNKSQKKQGRIHVRMRGRQVDMGGAEAVKVDEFKGGGAF